MGLHVIVDHKVELASDLYYEYLIGEKGNGSINKITI